MSQIFVISLGNQLSELAKYNLVTTFLVTIRIRDVQSGEIIVTDHSNEIKEKNLIEWLHNNGYPKAKVVSSKIENW